MDARASELLTKWRRAPSEVGRGKKQSPGGCFFAGDALQSPLP
jgi:hypothetical protein